jgi:hypothetical protein
MTLNRRNIAGAVLLMALSASASYAQQQLTQTVTKEQELQRDLFRA